MQRITDTPRRVHTLSVWKCDITITITPTPVSSLERRVLVRINNKAFVLLAFTAAHLTKNALASRLWDAPGTLLYPASMHYSVIEVG